MRQNWAMMAAGLTICFSGAWWACRAQDTPPVPMDNAVLSEKVAYLVLPPKVVATGEVDGLYPSTEGDRVLVTQHSLPAVHSLAPQSTPRKELSLLLWNAQSQKTTALWRTVEGDAVMNALENVSWIPKLANALVVIRSWSAQDAPEGEERPGKLYLVNGQDTTLRTLSVVAPGERLLVGSHLPVAVLYSPKARTIKVVDPDGRIHAPVAIPGSQELPGEPEWHDEGKSLLYYRLEVKNGKRVLVVGSIDIATGAITDTEETKFPRQEPTDEMALPPLRVIEGSGSLKNEQKTVPVHPLWLSGANASLTGQALVTANGEKPVLLPNTVLYQAYGTLYAVPILTVGKAEYLAERQRQLRMETLSNAKQIGVAMMMYCQDYDENFPLTDSNIRDAINPYLKNNQVFNDPATGQLGITFAYKETALASINSPATTVLGYLTGPNGRAVIYFDGHVKWEDNP